MKDFGGCRGYKPMDKSFLIIVISWFMPTEISAMMPKERNTRTKTKN